MTPDIDARLPNGATGQLVRTVTEGSRTLEFESHRFETATIPSGSRRIISSILEN